MATINLESGLEADRLTERGYGAIATLLACVIDRRPAGPDFRVIRDGEHYYSVTIQLLAMAAATMRYNSCQGG
jgi:endoglucanase